MEGKLSIPRLEKHGCHAMIFPSWEKMQLLQNYCKNFYKILKENALSLTNSCKICFNLVKFLQKHSILAKYSARVIFNLGESCSQCFVIALNVSDTFLRFVVSSKKLEEEANSRFRVKRFASVPKTTRMIQKDEIKQLFTKIVSFCISFQTN